MLQKLFPPLLVLILFLGCSDKVPSEGLMEEQIGEFLTKEIPEKWRDIVVFSDFEKTNGLQKDDVTYVADYLWKIKMKKSYKELKKESRRYGIVSNYGIFLSSLEIHLGKFEAGHEHKPIMVTPFTFLKKENGWILDPKNSGAKMMMRR